MKKSLQVKGLFVARSEDFCLKVPHLTVEPGEFLCITGPNGSGKSTFVECLCGLLSPSKGSVQLGRTSLSRNVLATKAALGYVPDDEDWFIKELSAREYFTLLKNIYWSAGVAFDMHARQSALASTLHFTAFDVPIQQLSHGNKKKVQIIAALMHKPNFIVVDEIRNGLDPLAIIATESLLRQEVDRGACVVAATHDLWWAERMADTVLMLVGGEVVMHKPIKAIRKKYRHLERAFMETVRGI